MTGSSPRTATSALLNLEIKLDGDVLPSAYRVIDVETIKEINRIPSARITLLDGSLSGETFLLSENDSFLPGVKVTISAGYRESVTPIFAGIIVRHAIKVRHDGRSTLVITCNDEAAKLTITHRSCQYTAKSDSAVIQSLIEAAGLTADVEATSSENAQMIQYTASDWDYIALRAEALGRVVIVDDGTVSVRAPTFAASALVVTYGESLVDAEIEIDARSQVASVSATSWDPSSQAVVAATGNEPTVNAQSNVTGKTLGAVLGQTDDLLTPATIPQDGLQTWADAQFLKGRLSRIRGRATFIGSAAAKVGTQITLQGVGDRFNGDAYVSRVTHKISAGVWRTEVGFGLSPLPFAAPLARIGAPPAAGLVPAAGGLQIGKVKQIHEDPDGQFRIKVSLPLITSDADSLWARMINPYAGVNMGIHFLPEVDDEIVVGFLDNDPSAAIVVGSLHSSGRAAPYVPDEKNTFKALVTASQMKLWFDDQKKVVCLETPGGHAVTLSDEAQSITILDSNGNKILLDSSGIKATSKGDFVVDVDGNVKLSGKQGITLDTPADTSVKGANVALAANMQLTAQGQVSAQLTSSAEVVVKGAIVMIN